MFVLAPLELAAFWFLPSYIVKFGKIFICGKDGEYSLGLVISDRELCATIFNKEIYLAIRSLYCVASKLYTSY